MNRKILAISGAITSISASASAQITGGSGDITSVFTIISEVLGINVGDPYNALAVLATLAIMSISAYIALKILFDKAGKLDLVLPQAGRNSGGRNILAILSVAITLSIFGTGAAAGIIQGFQSMFLLGFVFLMIAVGVFVLFGGTGLIVGGGSYVGGKSMKATADGIKEGSEALDEAGEILSTAEKEAEDGADKGNEEEEEDAARKIQDALETMNEVLVMTGSELEKDREEVNDAIEKVKDAIGLKQDEHEKIGYIDQRFKRANIFLHEAADILPDRGPGGSDLLNGEGNYNLVDSWRDEISIGAVQGIEGKHKAGPSISPDQIYGLSGVKEDFDKIKQALDYISEEIEEEEGEIAEAFEELMDAAEAAAGFHKVLMKLKNLLDEAERDDDLLEELAQQRNWKRLYDEADEEESEEKQLENRKAKITGEENALRNQLREALNLLNRHLQEDEAVIQEISGELEHEDRDIAESIVKLSNEVGDEGYEDLIGDLNSLIGSIETRIERIEDEDTSEDQREKEVIEKIQERLESDA